MNKLTFDDGYYRKLLQEARCGPHKFESIDFPIGSMSEAEVRRLWLCHANGKNFFKERERGKPVIVTTGFGLTGIPHVGTIAQIVRSIRLQKAGIPVQIVLGDLDAYNGKTTDLVLALGLVEKYRNLILKLGFDDLQPNVLRTQFEALPVLRTLYLTGHYITDEMFEQAKEDVHDYYFEHGKIEEEMTYRMKLSLNLMVADFIDLFTNHGFQSVLVFLGIDEYKYCGLSMDVAEAIKSGNRQFAEFSLSGIFSPLFRGFHGHPKMGKSLPDSGIDVGMTHDEIRKRIVKGEGEFDSPENNVVFQIMLALESRSESEWEEIYQACNERGKKWLVIKEGFAEKIVGISQFWTS